MLVSPIVRSILSAAGWYPGRHVAVFETIPSTHPAAAILSELTGVKAVPHSREGVECATGILEFRKVDFNDDEHGRIWSSLLRTELIGVAEMDDGAAVLCVAADGRCFGMSNLHDAFFYEGDRIEEAVERLLLGYQARPLLRPDQACVRLYGNHFAAGDPGLYDMGAATQV